jgi:hypothetical protein
MNIDPSLYREPAAKCETYAACAIHYIPPPKPERAMVGVNPPAEVGNRIEPTIDERIRRLERRMDLLEHGFTMGVGGAPFRTTVWIDDLAAFTVQAHTLEDLLTTIEQMVNDAMAKKKPGGKPKRPMPPPAPRPYEDYSRMKDALSNAANAQQRLAQQFCGTDGV